ncbi:hypothetical protein ACIGB8_24815 [Promicromonospora sukumoe]|uniref:hypothetical protein n=1 Tax=Promicromonospora sukumoe TaxID=88382 RepID=UPI0037C5852E
MVTPERRWPQTSKENDVSEFLADKPGKYDLDGDGIPDVEVADTDGDGVVDAQFEDYDGDGVPDVELYDTDGDGVPDVVVETVAGTSTISVDTDGDGVDEPVDSFPA